MTVSVTQQDKALLNLIAKHEAKSYNTVYGGKEIPLHQMTIAEVIRWQTGRTPSTACGRYQMLKQTVIDETKRLGVDPTQCRLTPDVQDAMMVKRLQAFRKYNQFKSLGLGATELENAQKFCIELAKEFASVPVPFNMQGNKRAVQKGQSFYAGDGLNKAHHNPDTFVAALIDIRKGGPGTNVKTVEIANGSAAGSNAYSSIGESPQQQMSNFATGGGPHHGRRVTGISTGAERQANGLPPAENVYVYEVIDPLDDRYDFRTGKKVTDITLYGTSSVAAYNQANSETAENTPASQLGVAPAEGVSDLENWTEEEVNELMDDRDRVSTQPGRYSDFFRDPYDPSQLLTVPGRLPPAPIAGNSPVRGAPRDGLTGANEPATTLPTPRTVQPNAPVSNTVPGLIPPGSSTSQPKPEQTNKRELAVKLQQDLDKAKRDINTTISDMKAIVDSQVEIYASDLRQQLTVAQNSLTSARQALAAAEASGNPTAIAQAQKAVFSAEGRVKNIENKLNSGAPYGLSTTDKHSRAKADPSYNQLLSSLTGIVNSTVPSIVQQARSLGIDLVQPNITAQLSAVPPIVKFN